MRVAGGEGNSGFVPVHKLSRLDSLQNCRSDLVALVSGAIAAWIVNTQHDPPKRDA